jgi:hypothetical protein
LASERQTTHVQEKQSLLLGQVPAEKLWLISAVVVGLLATYIS